MFRDQASYHGWAQDLMNERAANERESEGARARAALVDACEAGIRTAMRATPDVFAAFVFEPREAADALASWIGARPRR